MALVGVSAASFSHLLPANVLGKAAEGGPELGTHV